MLQVTSGTSPRSRQYLSEFWSNKMVSHARAKNCEWNTKREVLGEKLATQYGDPGDDVLRYAREHYSASPR